MRTFARIALTTAVLAVLIYGCSSSNNNNGVTQKEHQQQDRIDKQANQAEDSILNYKPPK